MTDKFTPKQQRDNLREELARLEKANQESGKAYCLLKAINRRDLDSIVYYLREDGTARDLLPPARALYQRFVESLKAQGLDMPELDSDGVTYQGEPKAAILPKGFELGKAVSFIDSACGNWRLTKNGDIELSGVQQVRQLTPDTVAGEALIGEIPVLGENEVFLSQGMVDSAKIAVTPIRGDRKVSESVVTTLVMQDSEGFCWKLGRGAHVDEHTQFNDPQILPPVQCLIYVKVPANTMTVAGSASPTTVDQILPAFRVKPLASRGDQMEYTLGDGSTIFGRFHWAYP